VQDSSADPSNDKQILWVYDKDQPGSGRPQTLSDTCVESGFYAVETSEGIDVEAETVFSRVEGDAKIILSELQQSGT
jgi:hypothetical protein